MLKQLYIRNFTLIDELNICFNPGFSVITGETGAGKSIILGAIALLMGNRADIKTIKNGATRCVVEAHFDISRYNMQSFFEDNDIDFDAQDCILRREVNSNGKSRAFINDTPVALTLMRELGERLIDIHSQHQNLLLNKSDFQLGVLDIIGKCEDQLNEYKASFNDYKATMRQYNELKQQIETNRQNEDFMRFQFKELDEANFNNVDEQEQLEHEADTMNHVEEIKSALFEADNALSNDDGILVKMRNICSPLQDIVKVYPNIKEVVERLSSCHIELKDIAREISGEMENVDFDPQRLDMLNARLDTIYSLEKKFHVDTISELIGIRDDIAQQLDQIDNSDEKLNLIKKKLAEQEELCKKQATKLTKMRNTSARKVEDEMKKRMKLLGMPNVQFEVSLSEKPLSADGKDQVTFLFNANKGNALQPISQVASGGEIARVMLSLKAMISGAVKLPTIIFDEIDTGVSGRVAEQMANIMNEMSDNNRQVISITHLPQIAAIGATHYKVAKKDTSEGTQSIMTQLDTDERILEIAQMLSGSNISQAAIDNAKSLLRI